MIFYCLSEIMSPTLIQSYNKNHFIFDPVQERETNGNFTGCQMPHFMTVLITIYQFILILGPFFFYCHTTLPRLFQLDP